MSYEDRWEKIEELGEGGQGKVYRVLDKKNPDLRAVIDPAVREAMQALMEIREHQSVADNDRLSQLRKGLCAIHAIDNPENQGALKELHQPKDARDPERAEERIKREIEAMVECSHPNLLKILDHDPDGRWHVSEFHPNGTLADRLGLFAGDVVGAMKALIPLVDGVMELHGKGFVHRDIKPQNVFIDGAGNLVLGDFGLVFKDDRGRISGTYENVGTRDWMPGWAHGVRLEDIKAMFDVFSLGKLLWSMISGKPILQLWYFNRPQFNLEEMFPDQPSMGLANRLLSRCIVENEKDCLPDAGALLNEMKRELVAVEIGADVMRSGTRRKCKVCGVGDYKMIVNEGSSPTTFGLTPHSDQRFRIFECDSCGNLQLFSCPHGKKRDGWDS